MALTAASNHMNNNNLGLNVKGNLGEIEVEDQSSDSDEERKCDNKSRAISSLSQNSGSLVSPSAAPVFGNISVSSSENVHFGNNTYFNGPVTIKQVIQSSGGVENASYTKTEDDDIPPQHYKQEPKANETPHKKLQLQLWHKLTFSAVCIICFSGICAVISIVIINNFRRENNSPTQFGDEESSSGTTKDPLLIAPNHLRIVSRTDWLAQPVESALDKIRQPVPWVIITHTATESCSTQSECVLRVRLIQMFHIESRKWSDIGYNFLVAGDGSAYYGRGWDYIGAHTLGYNKYSIGIAFIGTFNNEAPPKKQIEACQKLLQRGVELGKLAKDYKLFAHRQLSSTLSPGDKLFDILEQWPHFVKNFTDISELMPNY